MIVDDRDSASSLLISIIDTRTKDLMSRRVKLVLPRSSASRSSDQIFAA
jgi:hypothetical protein